MGSVLRSTKFLYSLFGFSRQKGSLISRKKIILFRASRVIFNSNDMRVRTVAMAAQAEKIKKENQDTFEELFFQLNLDLKQKRLTKTAFEKTLEALRRRGEMKHSYLMLLLQCCSEVSLPWSEEDRLKMAESAWKIATENGLPLNITHYNTLLHTYLINHHRFSPSEFLDSLRNTDIKPNAETYSLLLKAHCVQGNIEGAKLLLDIMKELQYPLNRQDFNSLIQGHCEIGDLEKAAEVLNIMERRKLVPFTDSYVHLLCGYAKHKEIEKLTVMLNELSHKGVVFTNSDLLEILCTLAMNNHDEHVDIILKRISKTRNYYNATGYILRLFDRKKDALALKLLETFNQRHEVSNFTHTFAIRILSFFVAYRDPEEILDICNKLEEKGFIKNPLSYALHEAFLNKNEDFCVSSLEAMEARKMVVKNHYYWPALIKASKKGNSELISILKRLSSKHLFHDSTSFRNIVLNNYKFSDTWKQDLENFKEIGVYPKILTSHFFVNFLKNKNLKEVEYLVQLPLDTSEIEFKIKLLFDCFQNHLNEEERFVNILYNLAKQFYINSASRIKKMKSAEEVVDMRKIFDFAVKNLLKSPYDEEVKQRILEAMLEKKMCISSEVGELIKSAFKSYNVDELVRNLGDPDLKFEISSNIMKKIPRDKIKKTLSKVLDSKASLDDCIQFMLKLARKNRFEDAVEVGEQLQAVGKAVKSWKKTNLLYKMFLQEFVDQNKDPMMLEKAFYLGMQFRIIKNSDFALVLQLYLNSKDTLVAVEKLQEHLLRCGRFTACLNLFSKLISEGNTEAVKRITNFLSIMYSKNLSLSLMFLALLDAGEAEMAKKILSTEKFEFDENILNYFCFVWSQVSEKYKSGFLEKILEILKNVNNLNRKSLYKTLALKYVFENRLDAIDKLWCQVQEDNGLSDKFVRQMAEFVKNPGLGFRGTTESMSGTFLRANKAFMSSVDDNDFQVLPNAPLKDSLSKHECIKLLNKMASEGKVSQVIKLISKLELESYIEMVAAKMLNAGKVNEFFVFVNHMLNEKKITKLYGCFNAKFFHLGLNINNSHLEKYESLAFRCLEKENFILPIVSYFVACLKTPGRLEKAEEVFVQYFDDFKKVPSLYLCNVAEVTERSLDFYKNVLICKKIKPHFFEQLHVLYNKIISMYCKENELGRATDFLKMAEADGVKDLLDKNLITLLNKKFSEIKFVSPNFKAASDYTQM